MRRRPFIKSATALGVSLALNPLQVALGASQPGDIPSFTAIQLSDAIRQKTVSCSEVMQAYLSHIHTYNPVYNAIVSLQDDESLLGQARMADQELARGEYRGWMHGMPYAVKDLSEVAGIPFTSGSPIYAGRIGETDSALAAKVRADGAIFIGKTNAPEFGLGSQTYNPVFGATGSACNPELTAGGSSGGAASALGTHMLPIADGSDMMGSLRNPAAFNNIIGYRPSTSVMNNSGASDRALSVSGPMGRNTADTIRLLQTVAVNPIGTDMLPINLRNVRIGWLSNFNNYLPMESGVLTLCEAALTNLTGAGCNVESIDPQFVVSDLWQCWTTLRHSGRSNMLSYYNNPASRPLLKPELVWEIEQSLMLTDQDIADANAIRQSWYAALDRLFLTYDFLVLPTAQVFPFSKHTHWPQQINGKAMDTYHRWMEVVIPGSLGGIPIVNVPVGFDAQGRPMGMQIMGKFADDRNVLEFALAYESITDHLQKRPQLIAASV